MKSLSVRATASVARSLSSMVVTLGVATVVAHRWGQADFASFSAVMWLVGISTVVPVMGFGMGIIRDVSFSRGHAAGPEHSHVFRTYVRRALPAVAAASALASIAAIPVLPGSRLSQVLGIFLLCSGMAIGSLHSSLQSGKEEFIAAAVFPSLAGLIALGSAAVLAIRHERFSWFWLITGSITLGLAIALVLPTLVRGRHAPNEALSRADKRFTRGLAAMGVLNLILWQRVEVFLLHLNDSQGGAAQYAAAVALTGGVAVLGGALLLVVLPAFARRNQGGDDFEIALAGIGTTVSGLVIAGSAFGPMAIRLAFGLQYESAQRYVAPLLLGAGACVLAGVACSKFVASGQLGPVLRILASMSVALIVADVVSIRLFGAPGAVVSNTVCQVIAAVALVRAMRHSEHAALGRTPLWRPIACTTATSGCAWLALVFTGPAGAIVVGAVSAVVLYLLFRPIAWSVVQYLLPLRSRAGGSTLVSAVSRVADAPRTQAGAIREYE